MSPPLQCHAETKKPENTERCFSLADYTASDFIKIDEDSRESKSTKTRLKSEKFRSYTEPDFISEMWQTRRGPTAKLKSLGEIFQGGSMHGLQIKKPNIRGLYENMTRSLRQMNPQICLKCILFMEEWSLGMRAQRKQNPTSQ